MEQDRTAINEVVDVIGEYARKARSLDEVICRVNSEGFVNNEKEFIEVFTIGRVEERATYESRQAGKDVREWFLWPLDALVHTTRGLSKNRGSWELVTSEHIGTTVPQEGNVAVLLIKRPTLHIFSAGIFKKN